MPTYERRTRIDAPLETVWQFHSQIEALEELTPDWMGLRVESVVGPDGALDPDELVPGTEISLSMRPFGVGPRQYVTSLITDREYGDGIAYFRDDMVRGPFDHWVHTHAFYADGDGTLLRDSIEYELPFSDQPTLGRLSAAATPFAGIGFEGMFRARHRTTKARLE